MAEDPGQQHDRSTQTPLGALETLAVQEVTVHPGLDHIEVFTLQGLLTILWHGPRDAERAVLLCGGAMGGLLGPAEGLYHDLGTDFADEGIASLRVSYRRPGDLEPCTHDLVAVADLASRTGARHFVTVGHSFGGAVALRAGLMLGEHCRGVVTLATQSAGCEPADQLAPTPMLLFHGDRDELLPPMASELVHSLAGGTADLTLLPGAGHLLSEAGDLLRSRLREWIPSRLDT